MGNCLASIFRRRNVRRHIVLLLIGLDNAGKTKTVNKLAGEQDDTVLPTVGFKAVNLVHKDTPVTIYDLGGGPSFRQIWTQYYSEVHGVIFVIDSSDFSRLDECKAVLEEVLSHDKIAGKPVLVLANKQDKKGALDDIDVVEKLNIEPLVNKYRCPTLVESYSASMPTKPQKKVKLDPGLKKGYQWLLNYIFRRYGDINLRVQTDIHADLERRKRLLNKAANRASQTFTAVSDDIATQTGFENPNYLSLTRDTTIVKDKELDSNLIIVKPISHVSNSLDTTVTIESADDSVISSAKPKLSPLFGRTSVESVLDNKIELEARSEFRKLSPIVRSKGGDQHIDFQNRPQSSPTLKKKAPVTKSSSTLVRDEDSFGGTNVTVDSYGATNVTVGLGDSWDGVRGRTVLIDDVEVMSPQREILFAERSELSNKCAMSDIVSSGARTLPAAAVTARPASASQLLRRQLELTHGQAHKRRLSLRYIQRNKTSPERPGVFRYEPKAPKAPRRQLDKGDFERAANYLEQDVHL